MRVSSFANDRKRGDAAHSKRWREIPRSSIFAKRLDCGAFRRFAPPGFNHAIWAWGNFLSYFYSCSYS
jgi:hypothetical protein